MPRRVNSAPFQSILNAAERSGTSVRGFNEALRAVPEAYTSYNSNMPSRRFSPVQAGEHPEIQNGVFDISCGHPVRSVRIQLSTVTRGALTGHRIFKLLEIVDGSPVWTGFGTLNEEISGRLQVWIWSRTADRFNNAWWLPVLNDMLLHNASNQGYAGYYYSVEGSAEYHSLVRSGNLCADCDVPIPVGSTQPYCRIHLRRQAFGGDATTDTATAQPITAAQIRQARIRHPRVSFNPLFEDDEIEDDTDSESVAPPPQRAESSQRAIPLMMSDLTPDWVK